MKTCMIRFTDNTQDISGGTIIFPGTEIGYYSINSEKTITRPITELYSIEPLSN